jgi:polyisoprenoid-binding protein YceI
MVVNQFLKGISYSIIIFSLLGQVPAQAKDYYYKFNQKESKIVAGLTTTIHPVDAVAYKFKGFIKIKSKDEKNIDSVDGYLEIDTASLLTKISACDIRMRLETLRVAKYPKMIFKVNKVLVISNKLDTENIMYLKLIGPFTIRDVTKEVEIPVKVTVAPDRNSATVDGNYHLNINDYKVPDPSVLIAKVNPILDISFKLKVY